MVSTVVYGPELVEDEIPEALPLGTEDTEDVDVEAVDDTNGELEKLGLVLELEKVPLRGAPD